MTYIVCVKGICQAKATLDKIKPVGLAVVELHLSEGIRQEVNQSVENFIGQKFLRSIGSILKAVLGLVIPNQYCQGDRMVL